MDLYIDMLYIEYGPAMIEHIILSANLNPNMKVATEFDSSDGRFDIRFRLCILLR